MARQWLSQSNVWAVVGPELLPLLVLFPWRTQNDIPRESAAFLTPVLLPKNPFSDFVSENQKTKGQ